VIVVALVLIVLFLIVIIFWLLGLYSVYKGKHEFGEAHRQKVSRGLTYVVIYIVLIVVAGVVAAALSVSFLFSSGIDSASADEYSRFMYTSTTINGIISIIAAVILGQAIISFVSELSSKENKGRLNTAFYLFLIGPIVGMIVTLVVISTTSFSDMSSSDFRDYQQGVSNLSSIGAIPQILAYYMFYTCYKDAHERVKNKVIEPVAPAYPPPGAYPPPPGYYPPPPAYGYYPPPPPSYYPPPPPHAYPPPHGGPEYPPPDRKPKGDRTKIQCPKCDHKFTVSSKARSVECPRCGATGEL